VRKKSNNAVVKKVVKPESLSRQHGIDLNGRECGFIPPINQRWPGNIFLAP
jgi:hypothetical protein